MRNSIWQEKWVRKYQVYVQLSMSMLGIALFLNFSGVAVGSRNAIDISAFVIVILAFIPLIRAIRLWQKAGMPWRFKPTLWEVAFRRPFDKYLLAIGTWNLLLIVFFAAMLLTMASRTGFHLPP